MLHEMCDLDSRQPTAAGLLLALLWHPAKRRRMQMDDWPSAGALSSAAVETNRWNVNKTQ